MAQAAASTLADSQAAVEGINALLDELAAEKRRMAADLEARAQQAAGLQEQLAAANGKLALQTQRAELAMQRAARVDAARRPR